MKNYCQHKRTLFMLFFLWLAGCSTPEPTPVPITDPVIQLGQTVFTDNCAICHANVPDTVLRGPSLHSIPERVSGEDTRTYIYNSIMRPSDYIVEGFDDLMPKTLAKDLTGEELDAVVAYLLTLK